MIDVASEQQLFIVIDARYFSRGSREAFEWIAEREKKERKKKKARKQKSISRAEKIVRIYTRWRADTSNIRTVEIEIEQRANEKRRRTNERTSWIKKKDIRAYIYIYIYITEWGKVKGRGRRGRRKKFFTVANRSAG